MKEPSATGCFDVSKFHDDDLLTVEQVACWLQVGPAWVREHANVNGKAPYLPGRKFGKYWRFRWGTLSEWARKLNAVEDVK